MSQTRAILKLKANYRVALTGTPIENNKGSNFQIFLMHSRHVLEGIRGGLYSETSIMATSDGTSGSGSSPGFRMPCFRLIPRLLLLYQP